MTRIYASAIALLLVCLSSFSNAQVTFTQDPNLLDTPGGSFTPECAVDMNGDYLDDIVRIVNDVIWVDFQNPDGSYTAATFNTAGSSSLWSICAGDLNGDGWNDLLFGAGNYVEFAVYDTANQNFAVNQLPEYIFSQRSTMADIDNDGNLDAFVCHDVDGSHPYRNDGLGNMTLDTSLIQTVDLAGNYSAIWTDYDNDNDIDLYITKCRLGSSPGDPERTNGLYNNDGTGVYTEVGAAANLDDNDQSWTTVFEDLDNDGDMDAFIVNHYQSNRLLSNNGDGTFTDTITNSGIDPFDLGAWEASAGDFDNDGFVDILSQLQNSMHWNNGNFTFTAQSLPFNDGAIADLNNDGFLDVYTNNGAYINQGNSNSWAKVTLEGTMSNKNGIGSRVEIYGAWGKQIRDVRSGQSFSPMSTINAHFGLGTATAIDSVVVRWPSGIVQTRTNVPINQALHLVEAEDTVNTSVRGVHLHEGLAVFPNPAADRITVQLPDAMLQSGQEIQLTVYTVDGQIAHVQRLNGASSTVVDCSELSAGAYFVQVRSGNTPVLFERLILK